MPKPWWQSKTLWFNAILAGLAALEANAGLIQPYLPGNVYGWGMMLLTCGNAVLRLVTSQGVSLVGVREPNK
jgi:hypothetical protein